VIQGKANPEVVECFTFHAGMDQMVHLHVSGRNMFITVIGVGDARSEWTFKTQARAYRFLVGQMARSNHDEPYAVTLAIEPASHCDLDQLALCQNTNQLAGRKLFIDAVTKFVAGHRGNYLYDAPVADQAFEVLGGPPDDVQRIGDL
jgi:hypothetical protein